MHTVIVVVVLVTETVGDYISYYLLNSFLELLTQMRETSSLLKSPETSVLTASSIDFLYTVNVFEERDHAYS